MRRFAVIALTLFSLQFANAADVFYTFSEQPTQTTAKFIQPSEAITQLQDDIFTNGNVDLLNWVENQGQPTQPKEKYDRDRHFGSWITDPSGSCMNVRGLVLQRGSKVPVKTNPDNHCSVEKGKWLDPYTNKTFVKAEDVQIDHVVPLKQAYYGGAWKWSPAKRCAFGNFMAYENHLLPVSGDANAAKGAKGPQEYLPSSRKYICQYLKNWLSIKMIWKLVMYEDEAIAIANELHQYKCEDGFYEMTKDEVKELRKQISVTAQDCSENTSH